MEVLGVYSVRVLLIPMPTQDPTPTPRPKTPEALFIMEAQGIRVSVQHVLGRSG